MKSEHMHISITKEQKETLARRAAEEGRSMNSFVGWLIDHEARQKMDYANYLKSPLDPRD